MRISWTQFKRILSMMNVENTTQHWTYWRKAVDTILSIQKQPEFLAQCAYESNFFSSLDENLNYKTSKRILAVFGKRIPPQLADGLTNNPIALAEAAYKNHPHLGNNTQQARKLYKEGWKVYDFRGQGYIQLTGFYNWRQFMADTKINCFRDKEYFMKHPWLASAYYWKKHDLDYAVDMTEMTKKINGGTYGLKHRVKILKDILLIMKRVD